MTFSCQSEFKVDPERIRDDITSLKTLEDKQEFLENMLYEKQMLNRQEDEAILIHGRDSKEHNKIKKRVEIEERVNLAYISEYFDQFGYPSRSELGQYAAYTPWVVVFHSIDKRGIKEDEFKYFYGAYSFHDLPEDLFLAYLKQIYQKKKNKNFPQEGYENVELLIQDMMGDLGYEV